jgi:hypothetical protein
MADHVHRVTMFKIPGRENQQKLIAAYAKVNDNNQKASRYICSGYRSLSLTSRSHLSMLQDGKRYIRSLVVGSAEEDRRAQGYTVVCKTEFANMDDMKFYDDACTAHSQFKETAKTLGVEGLIAVYFTPGLVGGTS